MTTNWMRTLLLSFTLALAGFSMALATMDSSAEQSLSERNAPRLIGTLVVSNPKGLSSGGGAFFDLGDAALGSQVLRCISAYGGTRPYTFTTTTAGSSGLALARHGILSGQTNSNTLLPFFFNATTTDSEGKTRTDSFRLGAAGATEFRFAIDRLPTALIGEDYFTTVQAVGATFPTSAKLSIVPGSLTFTGGTISTLESQGLTLFADGTLSGRPLRPGTISFTVRATRPSGQLAKNRANTAPDQTLSINVLSLTAANGGAVQTELVTSATNLRANLNKPGRDILGFNCFYNPQGLFPSDFANQTFTIRFGSAVYTAKLDSVGQARSGVVRVSNSAPTGLLKIKVQQQDFSALFDRSILVDRSFLIVPVQIQIGDIFLGVEPVQFLVSNRKGNVSLKYILGRQRQPGGMFQIVSLLASDTSTATAFKAKFLFNMMADTSAETFGDASNINVRIGPNFSQTVNLFHNKGRYAPDGIQSVNLSPRSKLGTIITYPLKASDTGVTTAKDGKGKPQNFTLGITVNTSTQTFSGKASRVLLP